MATHLSGTSIPEKPTSHANSVDPDTEVEEEVDQLDSDDDSPWNHNMKYNYDKNHLGPPADRLPGESLLPIVRVENILQAEGVTGNLALSKEGLFILSVATEEFIKRMAQAAQRQAAFERRNAVTYRDMAASIQQYQEFMFLEDTVPPPMPLSEALRLRTAREKELLEEDPAALSASAHAASQAETLPATALTKFKGKNRTISLESINGNSHRRAKVNGIDATREPTDSVRSENPWPSEHSASQAPPERSRATISLPPRTSLNGHASSSSSSTSGAPPPRPRNEYPSPSRLAQYAQPPLGPQEENWPGQFTGPASAFLQGPGGPFGRSAPNPGRTIYSPQSRTD
ncbi:hypothetical protein AX16_008050 [Volvariella volvacea WC 439]|nr:hypothetical protein AX16_008050 [Volvariella volvacea WC 439]